MKIRIEIRPAEGGEDAARFASELQGAYRRMADAQGWQHQAPIAGVDTRTLSLIIEGKGAKALLGEAGGHRIQRVPEGERTGRVHSSTVTVSVLTEGSMSSDHPAALRDDTDFKIEWYSGSGAGGQHRNKHQNSVRLRHLPTGLVVTAQCRKRDESMAQAIAAITLRLDEMVDSSSAGQQNGIRSDQIGSGMRGDKRRTYRFRDDKVVDHVTGKSCSCRTIMRGGFKNLW